MSDPAGLSALDLPNSYIGRSVPRPNARRLLQGRGTFVDDIRLPRLCHAAFVRSPYAHARISASIVRRLVTALVSSTLQLARRSHSSARRGLAFSIT